VSSEIELQRKDDIVASLEASAVVILSALKDNDGLAKAQ